MKQLLYLCTFVLAIWGLSCRESELIIDSGNQPGNAGKISISFLEHPAGIVLVVAHLTRPHYTDRIAQFQIADSGQNASGSFSDVPVGTWHLKVDALDSSSTIRYSGETDVDVLPGQVSTVELELLPTSGSILIRVRWGGTVCVPLPSGCVGWWTGDGTPNDIVGGNNGYFEGGTSFSHGMVGQAFHFDGQDDRLRIPDADALKLTGSLTMEGWIYLEGYPTVQTGGEIFFRGDDRYGFDPYSLSITRDGKLHLQISSSVTIDAPVSTLQFHHVAGTLDSATGDMRLYIDGLVVAETTTTIRPFRDLDSNYTPGVGIGNTQGTGFLHNHPFPGLIDEIAVYDRALSQEEIRRIYRAGSVGKCKPG